jgi:hypothetical protein
LLLGQWRCSSPLAFFCGDEKAAPIDGILFWLATLTLARKSFNKKDAAIAIPFSAPEASRLLILVYEEPQAPA